MNWPTLREIVFRIVDACVFCYAISAGKGNTFAQMFEHLDKFVDRWKRLKGGD